MATISISSDPQGADIEINGEFAGMTPRDKQVEPGEYLVRISLSGYETWSRQFEVAAGEEFPIRAPLQKQDP